MQVEEHEVVMARRQPLARRGERVYPVELRYSGVMAERGERRIVIGRHRAQVGAHQHAKRLVVFDEQDARDVLVPAHAARAWRTTCASRMARGPRAALPRTASKTLRARTPARLER